MKHLQPICAGLVLVLALAACSHDSTTAPNTNEFAMLAAEGGSENGVAGQMPAYYEGEILTINIKELSESATESMEKNPRVTDIFAYADLEDEQPFFPVIDAVQGEDFNPLWEQYLIVFNSGFAPHQFFDEEEVEAAEASGEITIIESEEIYRCSIVGQKTHE